MFNTYITVKVLVEIKTIKYLFKYIYKSNDRVAIEMAKPIDEIKQYLDVKYFSIIKIIDSLLSFHTYYKKPLMRYLVVYLLSQYNMMFNTTKDLL